MPVPIRLKISKAQLDLDELRLHLTNAGTTCESPRCDQPAVTYHQSSWSFAYICLGHQGLIGTLPPDLLLEWEMELAEHLFEMFLMFSFTHQNIQTEFALQEAVNERVRIEREIKAAERKRSSQERRELRTAINRSQISIGTPDDQLLVARQRQAIRKAHGKPLIGVQKKDKVAILRPKLIVTLRPSAEKTET